MSGWYGFPCDWLMFTLSKLRSMRSGSVIVPGLRRSSASPVCTFAGTLSFGTPSPGSGVGATTSTAGAWVARSWASAVGTPMPAPHASIPPKLRLTIVVHPPPPRRIFPSFDLEEKLTSATPGPSGKFPAQFGTVSGRVARGRTLFQTSGVTLLRKRSSWRGQAPALQSIVIADPP